MNFIRNQDFMSSRSGLLRGAYMPSPNLKNDSTTGFFTVCGGAKIIGDGILRLDLLKEIQKHHLENKIELLGTKSQTEIPNYMHQTDVLILPSLYDGWGAVVNEALLAGCYVICSDAAGASNLINKEERLGIVFHRGDILQLADCVEWCNNNISEIRSNRKFRKKWAEEHIDGKVVARYMIDCLIKTMF